MHLDTAVATCVAAVGSQADKVVPPSYRIPVTARVVLTVFDSTAFRLNRSSLAATLDFDAVSDSGVVLGTASAVFSPTESDRIREISGAISGLSPDDAAKTRFVRVHWHFAR